MPHCTRRRRTRQVELLRSRLGQAGDRAFADVLPARRVERALAEEGATWREVASTPLVPLWAFLGQGVSADGSCRAAGAGVLAWLVSRGERPCTPKTDPYCTARRRRPESLFTRLVRETGAALHGEAPAAWRWHGRRVKVVDGSTVSMPDPPANQAAYPQPGAQQPGLGFPLARVVVVFCLACGTVLDAALGKYRGKQAGENSLARSLEGAAGPGAVLLGDRYFGGYCDIAHGRGRGADGVLRLHQWTCSAAGRRRWCARSSGRTCWPTTGCGR
jgi:hypothetical protein